MIPLHASAPVEELVIERQVCSVAGFTLVETPLSPEYFDMLTGWAREASAMGWRETSMDGPVLVGLDSWLASK